MEALPSRTWSGSDLLAGVEHVAAMSGLYKRDVTTLSREELIKQLQECMHACIHTLKFM